MAYIWRALTFSSNLLDAIERAGLLKFVYGNAIFIDSDAHAIYGDMSRGLGVRCVFAERQLSLVL